MKVLRPEFLDHPQVLVGWLGVACACTAVVLRDLRRHNPQLAPLMKWVWGLTVLYSGPLGLAVYFWAGRKQISRDSLPRRGLRSTAHCYAGCGLGEGVGLVIAVGILSLGGKWVMAATFLCAYSAGLLFTVGPLVQDGMAVGPAFRDGVITETGSIVAMETVAIGVDRSLARDAGLGNPLFWTSLAVSLTAGFLAAYPVNLLLIRFGVKRGMHDPRM